MTAAAGEARILSDAYASEQMEVERRLEDVMSAARRRAADMTSSRRRSTSICSLA